MSYSKFTQQSSISSRATKRLLTGLGISALAVAIGVPSAAHGQFPGTYTQTQSNRFSNVDGWNFAAGYSAGNPVPFSDPAGVLAFQGFGSAGPAASNDFNLTLNTIKFNMYGPTANLNFATTNGGTYSFTGAANIQMNGSGGGTGVGNYGAQISSGFVLTSTATGLSFTTANTNGIAALNTNMTSVIASNTFAGAAITVNTGALANTGVLVLTGANTFAGGIKLTSGALQLANSNAIGILGNQLSTLTINSASSGAATLSSNGAIQFLNPVVTTAGGGDLVITGGRGNESTNLTIGGFLGNGVSGPGNVIVRGGGIAQLEIFQGINTYAGATTIGQIQYASNGTPGAPNVMRLQGAVGQLTATTGITATDGAGFEINKNVGGDSINNVRVAGATPISLNSGILNVIGSAGFTTQSLGALTVTGGASIGVGLNGASQAVTISNLVRSGAGTVNISGTNLGGAAAAVGVTNANVIVTNINGAAPAGALSGGGGAAGTNTISIIPWAIGDSQNAVTTATGTATTTTSFGSGFVTVDSVAAANSVRLLNPATEYRLNDFTAVASSSENFRIAAAVVSPTAPVTVNSLFNAFAGQTIGVVGDTNTITIGSGALASNQAALTINNPVIFGGTGEGIVTVVGGLGSGNTITVTGAMTGTTLTKAGGGILALGTSLVTPVANSFTSNTININAGVISIPLVANLGISQAAPGSSTINFNMQTSSSLNGGLVYIGTGSETLNSNLVVNGGHAEIRLTGAGGNLNVAGQISGSGWINIDPGAASTVTLAAGNTYTGGTRIGSGSTNTLNISGDSSFGAATAPITINSGGNTLKLAGNWITSRQIALEGAWGQSAVAGAEGFDTAGFNSTWSGQILGAGNIFKIDSAVTPGTWTVASVNNPYTGTIQLGTTSHAGGTLSLTGDLNSAAITFGPAAAGVAGTYVLDLSQDSVASGSTGWRSFTTLNTGAGFTQPHTVQLGPDAGHTVDLRVGGTNASTFGGAAGQIIGSGSLVITSGTVTLNGTLANTFVGSGVSLTAGRQVGVEIWGGTFQPNADILLGDASNDVAMKGGKFQLPTITNIVTARNFQLQASPYTLIGTGPDNTWNFQTAGNGLTINGNVYGNGGFEMGGAGFLYLTADNSLTWKQANAVSNNGRAPYGGQIKLNTSQLRFNNDNNLGDAANKITMLNAGTFYLVGGNGTQISNRFIDIQGTNQVSFQVDAGSTLQYNGSLWAANSTAQSLRFLGAGQLNWGADSSHYVSTIQIGDGTNPSGNFVVTANAQLPRVNLVTAAGSGATIDMSGLTKDVGNLNLAAGTTLALGQNLITGAGQVSFGFNNANTTFAGTAGPPAVNASITGVAADTSMSLFQAGTGGVNVTANLAANPAAWGGGYIVGFAGNLVLNGANATLPLQGGFGLSVGQWGNGLNRGPGVLVTDSTVAHFNPNQTVYLNSAEFSVTGNAAGVPVTQAMLSLQSLGFSIVTVGNTTAGASVAFTDPGAGLIQVSNGTFLFRSGSTGTLGSAAASATVSNLKFGTGLPGLIGGGGAAGTTTISISPYSIGDDSASGPGNTFVTYGAANGVRTLQAAEFAAAFGGGINDNVRINNAVLTTTTLASPTTANSLIVAGTPGTTLINGATSLTINSGAVLSATSSVFTNTFVGNAPVGQTLGIQTNSVLTGTGNTNPLYVSATYGDLLVSSLISTQAGLVKSGYGTLYLTNNANSFGSGGAGLTINGGAVAVTNLGAISDSVNAAMTMTGGFLRYLGPSAVMQTQNINFGFQGNVTSLGGGFYVVSTSNLTIDANSGTAVIGFGGLNKDGNGTLSLLGSSSGNYQFSGPVILAGGQIAVDGPGSFGLSNRVLFGPDSSNGFGVSFAASQPGASIKFLPGAGASPFTQEFDIVSNNPLIGAGFDTNGQNVTISGVINSPNTNTKGLYKFGTGNLNLTAAELYVGATQAFGGTITISGANGNILNSGIQGTGSAFSNTASLMANFGAGIVLDNTAAANSTRIPSGFTTAMSNGDSQANGGVRLQGGNFDLIGNAATAVNEYAGQFNIFAGTVTLTNIGASTVLTSGRLVRTSNDTIGLIRGTGLGNGVPAAGNTNWYQVDQGSGSTQVTGAGGAKGTPFINILPGFSGDTSATGTGTDLVTYDSAVGFRLLSASEYTTSFAGTIGTPNYDDSRAPIIGLSASASAPAFTSWISALKLSGNATLSGTGGLVVRQSTILATGNGTPSITVPMLGSFGNGGYDIITAGTTNLTISSDLNGAQLFVFGGAGSNGTLTLSGKYFGAGQVFVGQGATLALSGANAFLNPLGSNVNVAFGGVLTLGGFDRRIASINTQSVIGTFNLGQVSDGTIALGSNNLTLYDNPTSIFTGQITGSTASTLTKGFFSASTTTVTQPQPSFNGTVRVNNGTFQLAGLGTMLNAAGFDIRGGTLALNNSDDLNTTGAAIPQRISSTVPINLAGGLTFVGNGNAVNISHNLGQVTLVGAGTVTVPDPVTINNLARSVNHGTLIVSAPVTNVSNFANGTGTPGSGWQLNIGNAAGSASFTSTSALNITTAVGSANNSAWYTTPVSTRAFTASWTYQASTNTGADGISFGFQGVSPTTVSTVNGGSGLSIQGVAPSAVLQMNIYQGNNDLLTGSGGNNGVGFGVDINGGVMAHVQVAPGINAANPFTTTVNYDGTTITVLVTQTGVPNYSTSFPMNIASAVGASAFVGFTGSTGGVNAAQTISNFSFNSQASSLGTVAPGTSVVGGANLTFTQIDGAAATNALIGGGGADGTTTVSIIPWAWSSTAGGFVTYTNAKGVRPLNTGIISGSEYASAVPAVGAGTFDNVRLTGGPITLPAGNTEMNSLIQTFTAGNITGPASAAATLGVRSGALAFTGTTTVAPGATGGTLALTTGSATTGNLNVPELVVFNTAAVTLNAVISTTGGVTKYGGGALTLAGVNTFSGGLTINGGSVAYSNDNQFGAAGPVTFGIPTNAASPNGFGLQYTGTVLTTPAITRNFVTNSFGGILGPVNQVTTLNNVISGTGVFAYNALATGSIYEVNGNNTYTGDTYINFGHVSVGGATPDAAFGSNPNSVIQMNSGSATDGFDLRSDWTTSHTIHMRSGGNIDTPPAFTGVNGASSTGALTTMTVNTPIIGTAGITKQNEGTLILTAPNPTTGVITLNAGSLVLTGRGALVVAPSFGFGTQGVLDDNGQGAGGAASHYSDRLPQTVAVSGNNYEFKIIGNDTVTTEQTIAVLTLGGASKVTLVSNGQPTILRLGQDNTNGALARSASGSIVFRGTNLGVNVPGTANSANIMVTNPTTAGGANLSLTGGGGPANNTAISIIPGSFGDTSATGNGTQLVTYDLTKGVRLLNPATEYATAAQYPNGINGTVMVDNLHLTASQSGIANATTVNALWLDGTGGPVTVAGGGTLTVTAGNLLLNGTGANASVINTPITTGGSNAIAVGGTGDLNITAAITATTTGGVIKTGDGNLTLSAANLYTGTTYIAGGTLTINNAAAITAGTTVRFMGGTLAAGSPGLTLAATNPVGLDQDLNFAGSNDFTIAGTVSLDSGARTFNVAAGRTLTFSGLVKASNDGISGSGITIAGGGKVVMSLATGNTYGGVAGTTGFYLTQTIVNSGELNVRNASGSGTGGSTVVVNNGGILSGTGFIVPTQQLESRNTVTINSGGVLSPGNSPGVLTMGATTTPGVTTAAVLEGPGSFFRFLYTPGASLLTAAPDTGGSNVAGDATGNNELQVNGTLTLSAGVGGTYFRIVGDANDFTVGQNYSFLVANSTNAILGGYDITSPGPLAAQFDTTQFANFVPGLFTMEVHSVGSQEYFNLTSPVPEPSSLVLLGAGAVGLAGAIRRRRKAAKALDA